MNFEETKIYELEKKLGFSYKTDLPILFIVLVCIFLISDIVNLLHNIYPPWGNSLKEIIKRAYSTKYFSRSIYFILLLIIIISSIWPFFRRYRICLKIVKLREKQLDKSRSDYKQLEIALRSQRTVIKVDKGYFGATIDRGKENNTAPTQMLIDEYIDSIPDIANDTANPHNEDQE
jgi:hypothetical protein